MKGETIAESVLVGESREGGRFAIHIKIGKPYPADGGDWRCPVLVEGIPWRFPDIYGTSSLQALQLATQLARKALESFLEKGGKLWHSDEATAVSIDALFGCGSPKST